MFQVVIMLKIYMSIVAVVLVFEVILMGVCIAMKGSFSYHFNDTISQYFCHITESCKFLSNLTSYRSLFKGFLSGNDEVPLEMIHFLLQEM